MVVFSVVVVFLCSQRHRKGAEQSKVPKACESLGTAEIPGCRHILEALRSQEFFKQDTLIPLWGAICMMNQILPGPGDCDNVNYIRD